MSVDITGAERLAADERRRPMDGERRMVQATMFRGRTYWTGTAGWILYFLSPVAPGWLIGAIFDEYQTNGTTRRAAVLLVLLVVAELAIIWGIAVAHRIYMRGNESAKALMRANVVDAQLASGGQTAGRRDVPIGDVLVRLRDDPFDMMFLVDNWIDLVGALLYSSTAAYFLFRIDTWAALAGIGPMIVLGLANRLISQRARRYRTTARGAASDVSGFLNATFEASLTVKVTGARRHVLDRLAVLNRRRGHTAVADDVWNEVVWTFNGMMADVVVGIAILVAATGSLSAGEITLFFAYLAGMTWLPMRLGGIVAGRRRYEVSAERLDALVASSHEGDDRLVTHRPLSLLGGDRPAPPRLPERIALERLEVRHLVVESRGLRDVSFTVERGQLVVISGPVGSGKSSLLRAVIGLIDIDDGEVLWNGTPVEDRAAFFVPPQSAYVAQVPRLFAESLADNLRLGHGVDDEAIAVGVELAAFEDDLAMMPEGLATVIGARGVRLSGGQVQRAAGARALVHRPELLVLDDLTSALDVDTELVMWQRLAASGYTVLAASNRPVALSRADVVIEL